MGKEHPPDTGQPDPMPETTPELDESTSSALPAPAAKPVPPADATQPKREATIDRLQRHFARDDLGIEEFERRLDDALRASSVADLEKLVSDLPAPLPPETLPQAAPEPELPGIVPPERVKKAGFVVTFLGVARRKGRWTPPRRLFCLHYLGGAELDFRDALGVHPVTEVYIGAFLGGVKIIVPPGLAVEIDGIPLLGRFGSTDDVVAGAGPSAPLLRVRGICFLGGAGVQMRYPGESGEEAKERRLLERQVRRRRFRDS